MLFVRFERRRFIYPIGVAKGRLRSRCQASYIVQTETEGKPIAANRKTKS